MTAQTPTVLKTYFVTSAKPTQQQFANLIDSGINIVTSALQTITGGIYINSSAAIAQTLAVSGATSLKSVSVSGNVTINGGNIALTGATGNISTIGAISTSALSATGAVTLTNFPATSTSFSPGFTGFSANPTVTATYQKIGKRCFINIITTGDGTSNATSFTMTGLPFAAAQTTFGTTAATDNGSSTAAVFQVSSGTQVITLGKGTSVSGTWTNSGSKSSNVCFSYETTT